MNLLVYLHTAKKQVLTEYLIHMAYSTVKVFQIILYSYCDFVILDNKNEVLYEYLIQNS